MGNKFGRKALGNKYLETSIRLKVLGNSNRYPVKTIRKHLPGSKDKL